MTTSISATTPVQQQQCVQPQMPQQAQACPSYNAVQLNIKNPGVNVAGAPQQPMPQTATKQWQA